VNAAIDFADDDDNDNNNNGAVVTDAVSNGRQFIKSLAVAAFMPMSAAQSLPSTSYSPLIPLMQLDGEGKRVSEGPPTTHAQHA